jgi:cytochrome P450
VLVVGPELNRRALSDLESFRSSGPIMRGPTRHDSALYRISAGLTRGSDQKHQQQRRVVMPAFHKGAVGSYCDAIATTTDRYLDGWSFGQNVDMWREIRKLILLVANKTLFDLKDPEAASALGTMIQEWFTLNFSLATWLIPVKLPGLPYCRLHNHAERLERELLRVISEKRADATCGSDVLSLLTRAQHDGDPMSDAELVSLATILFAASYETTVNALTWTLFLLAQHPSIMADLLDELDGTLKGGPPTSDQLDHLPFLEAVIKESMRILPPVPFVARVATGPVELGGLSLRRGDWVACSIYMTHRLPDLYFEPEQFRPGRWFEINPTPYEYLPFGAGPYSCIGYNFAKSVIKISLAMILQRFRLTVVPGTRIDRLVQVTMRPKYGMPMTVHQQDRRFHAVPVTGNIHEMVRLTEGC